VCIYTWGRIRSIRIWIRKTSAISVLRMRLMPSGYHSLYSHLLLLLVLGFLVFIYNSYLYVPVAV